MEDGAIITLSFYTLDELYRWLQARDEESSFSQGCVVFIEGVWEISIPLVKEVAHE